MCWGLKITLPYLSWTIKGSRMIGLLFVGSANDVIFTGLRFESWVLENCLYNIPNLEIIVCYSSFDKWISMLPSFVIYYCTDSRKHGICSFNFLRKSKIELVMTSSMRLPSNRSNERTSQNARKVQLIV